MFSRSLIALLLSLFWATSSFAVSCGNGAVSNPTTFQWEDRGDYFFGVLEMGEATFTINGEETLTTRAYRQEGGEYSIPGPTLVMTPGNKYVLRFKNTLPYQPASEEHNVFKDPNVTNLHTHGLHISGETPGDDVTRAFEGGYYGDYVYDILPEHMGGTFWYHAHHHGSTFLQVSTGAFGLIIIEDKVDDLIPANVSNMVQQHLVLGFLEPGNAAGTGGDSLISGSFSSGWTINGSVGGEVCLPANTWQHWRMLVADQDSRPVDLQIGDGCEVALMARDGVWRTEVPKALPDGTLTLTGASRADLAVKCSENSNPTITVGGTQVANIVVAGSPPNNDPAHPYAANGEAAETTWSAKRPNYLRDLRGTIPADSETIRMGARTILGRKFDKATPNLTKDANGVQEWNINGAGQHPFHLHIYHVQVQSDCGPYEAGEYYDVIAGNCTVRFDMSDPEAYEGRTIFHCHILEHEDQGAMAWMDVIGGRPAPVFPIDENEIFTWSSPIGGGGGSPPTAPSGLAAEAISESRINLAWLDNSNNETGFVIDRSMDGQNYFNYQSVGADTITFSDTSLQEDTTYYYQVASVNAAGTSDYSDPANATTLAAGVGTSVAVGSITLSTTGASRGQKAGQATISVVDDLGRPVTNTLVSGVFTGDFTGTVDQADTGNSDTVAVQSTSTVPNKTKSVSFTFCVTDIEHDSLEDFTGSVCNSQ
jgi:FtsP/CotA-like multicopper oxidase with cupredoxin domain